MQSADLDVVKDIPGYKVILKAILKSQIQQLVEQLASHTEEESVILTASVSDGTLSHLGSSSGKGFLQDHDDIKSQFLGFCLKRHHRQKQQEKEQEEREAQQKAAAATAARAFRPRPFLSSRGSRARYHPPRQPGYRLPSPGGVRHEPYRIPRPTSSSIHPSLSSADAQNRISASPSKPLIGNEANQAIKIEPDDSDETRHSLPDSDVQSESNLLNVNVPTEGGDQSSLSSVPALPSTPVKSSNSTESTPLKSDPHIDSPIKPDIPSGSDPADFSDTVTSDGVPVPSNLTLDADLSNLISPAATSAQMTSAVDTDPDTSGADVDIGPDVNVKLEAISEADMELEITGVEPGTIDPMASQDASWGPGTMGYDSSGATGSQGDLAGGDQSYSYYSDMDDSPTGSKRGYQCQLCGKTFMSKTDLARHVRVHTGEKPFRCDYCDKAFSDKSNMRQHIKGVHFKQRVRRTKLVYPEDGFENVP